MRPIISGVLFSTTIHSKQSKSPRQNQIGNDSPLPCLLRELGEIDAVIRK